MIIDISNYALKAGAVIRGPQREYTVVKVLGSGGFGITYLVSARIKAGNIPVKVQFAVKEHFLDNRCWRSEQSAQVEFPTSVAEEVRQSQKSFFKEAQRLQKLGLDHPNLVKVNEVFMANNTAYYVMEYLDAQSLRAHIEQNGALTPDAAMALLEPICRVVDMLHKARVAHYDIKPDNIMLTRDDADGSLRPVLIDFGLARHYDTKGRLTSTTGTGGYTPGYAPIEQYRGLEAFSPRCDVYALAATMVYCLTGTTPPDAFSLRADFLAAQLEGECTPGQIAAITHAMAMLEADRTASVAALLDEWAGSEPASDPKKTKPVSPKPAFPKPAFPKLQMPRLSPLAWKISAAAATVIVVAIALYFGLRTPRINSDRELDELLAELRQSYRQDLFGGFYAMPADSTSEWWGSFPLSRQDVISEYDAIARYKCVYNRHGNKIPLPDAPGGTDSICVAEYPTLEYIDANGLRRCVALFDDRLYYYMGYCGNVGGADRYALANYADEIGIIDQEGNVVKNFAFSRIDYTKEGYYLNGDKNQTFDMSGQILPVEENAPARIEKRLIILENSGKKGIFDLEREETVVPTEFDDISIYGSATNMYPAKRGGKWGYVRRGGQVAIPFKFDQALSFNPDTRMASVKTFDAKCGYIDMDGNFLIAPTYYSAGIMRPNGARVMRSKEEYGFIDTAGNLITGWYPGVGQRLEADRLQVSNADGRTGFVDSKGTLVIPFVFDYAEDFDPISRMCKVRYKNNPYWYVNTNGAFCHPCDTRPSAQAISAVD